MIIKARGSIEKHLGIIEESNPFGDLEVNLIICGNYNQAMLTINDRAFGMLKIRKIPSKETKVVSKLIVKELAESISYIKIIKADNGNEFSDHKFVVKKLCIDYYFARP